MFIYPLTPDDNGTFLVQFPDIPEAITVTDDETEALVNGQEALETAIEIYFDEKRGVPETRKIIGYPGRLKQKPRIWRGSFSMNNKKPSHRTARTIAG